MCFYVKLEFMRIMEPSCSKQLYNLRDAAETMGKCPAIFEETSSVETCMSNHGAFHFDADWNLTSGRKE